MTTMRKLVVTSIAVTTIGGLSVAATGDGGELSSQGRITFEPSKGEGTITPPGNPEKPGEPVFPIDPTQPEGKPQPGGQGPLSIDFVSSFDFGVQEITSLDKDYKAHAQRFTTAAGEESEMPNFVQITDNRGTEAGWTLKVTQSEQFQALEKTGKELTGAKITLGNANRLTHSDSALAVGPAAVDLTPGEAALIMMAEVDSGAGTHFTQWGTEAANNGAESVNLFVPGKTTKFADQYQAELVWELSDAVTNKE